MQAVRREAEDVLPLDFGGHLHTFITLFTPYALRMQPYAVRMHFFAKVKKSMKSRAESACKKPYALYAPLLGVGVFSALFLLRELHTVHTTAYVRRWNRAPALLPVGIGAPPARESRKCIRIRIRIFADFGRKRPSMKLIRLCPASSPADARAGFCPWKRFFGPSDGLSSFWGIVCRHPIRAVPQGEPRIRFSGNDVD